VAGDSFEGVEGVPVVHLTLKNVIAPAGKRSRVFVRFVAEVVILYHSPFLMITVGCRGDQWLAFFTGPNRDRLKLERSVKTTFDKRIQ